MKDKKFSKKIKMLESYVREQMKEVDTLEQTPTSSINTQNQEQNTENTTIKKEAIGVAKDYVDLNEKLKGIKTSYEKVSKSTLRNFTKEVFGDPFSNLVEMTETAYKATDIIMTKLKVGSKEKEQVFSNVLLELKNLYPEAQKSVDEIVSKYSEVQNVENSMDNSMVNEDFVKEFKNLMAGMKNWAVKFNYRTEYLKNKVEQIYYKLENSNLFTKSSFK